MKVNTMLTDYNTSDKGTSQIKFSRENLSLKISKLCKKLLLKKQMNKLSAKPFETFGD